MTNAEFDRFRNLVYARTHIFCTAAQKHLFERKIRARLAAAHLSSFQDYYRLLTESNRADQELTRLIDAIAVHETAFFRISGHFSGLQTVVFPELLRQKQPQVSPRDILVWSAGCSTGEEPYSIAIAFLETASQQDATASQAHGIKIVATDVSPSVIEKAREGIYASNKVRKISKPLLDKYFEYRDDQYYIAQHVKNIVHFQVFNLINLAQFAYRACDLIFCRNLLIYFDRSAQKRLLTGLINLLSDGGYLFLGDAESLHIFPESAKRLAFVESGNALIYQKRGVHAP